MKLKLQTNHIISLLLTICLATSAMFFSSCQSTKKESGEELFYNNPVYSKNSNTIIYYHEGFYYNVQNSVGKLFLRVFKDPTEFNNIQGHVACNVTETYNLLHMWRPQIINIDGVWYIYITADDGNTDNHQLYLLVNRSEDPREGVFEIEHKISTDKDDNWAIHQHVFQYEGDWYMAWSGWESRRVFVETQCIFIAKMLNPWTLSSERVKISEPIYEWERQWIRPDGYRSMAYPVFVNESPAFFNSELCDSVYMFYSASANWTQYCSIGQLSAKKGSDILDPNSWTKSKEPVFKQAEGVDVYGPGTPYIVESPDGKEHFLAYSALVEDWDKRPSFREVFLQKMEIDENGVPNLGTPKPREEKLKKPSGL